MPYTLIKGSFHIFNPADPHNGPEPDGDTIKFLPDNRQLILDLPRPNMPPQFNLAGLTSIRFEGIDALETHFTVEGDTFHQQISLALEARDVLLQQMGFGAVTFFTDKPYKVQSVEHHPIQGYILSNGVDTYGRTIAFVFTGEHPFADGYQVYLTAELLDASMNVFLLQQGEVYPAFYLTLPAELRQHLEEVSAAARTSGKGVWALDTANPATSATIPDLEALQQLVIWPKLFRRLAAYFQGGYTGLGALDGWLRADPKNRDDRLILLNRELGNMHDIIVVEGNNVHLEYLPEELVIVPDDYTLPVPVPTPVPVPQPEAMGAIRIIAALVNPAEQPESAFETVTLLNVTNADIDINGWFIADATGREPLEGIIKRGETLRIHLGTHVRLSNVRDTITVLNGDSKTVDQVSYERKNLPKEGYTVIF